MSNAKPIEIFPKVSKYRKRKALKCPTGRPLKSGAYFFLRTGCVPPGKTALGDLADAAIGMMAEDLGGVQNLTGGQLVILREIRQLLIYKFLCDEWVASTGLFTPDGKLNPAMSAFYLSCSNSITRNCFNLGLKRISKSEEDIQTYIAANYPPKNQASSGQRGAIRQDAPGATISESHDQGHGKDDESQAAPGGLDAGVGESDPNKESEK